MRCPMLSIEGKVQDSLAIGIFRKFRLPSQGKLATVGVMNTSNQQAVDAAIKAAGGRRSLANALGISYEAVRLWKEIPVKRIAKVSELTGIPRHELRPDIFGGV